MDDFSEYIRQVEPSKRERAHAWQIAIGLQAVDALKTSQYLIATACQHIEEQITIEEAKQLIEAYYQSKPENDELDDRTEEADKVAVNIAELLMQKTFNLSPVEYLHIHRKLFEGVYEFAGKIRDYNITKNEWVLNGDTVLYASAESIEETLNYYFAKEKNFAYQKLSISDGLEHLAKFISDIWKVHAFGEGNTRTTAVFTIRYLRYLGLELNADTFAKHSWFFRNALVRANYSNLTKGIYATNKYLEAFFDNLTFSESHELNSQALLV